MGVQEAGSAGLRPQVKTVQVRVVIVAVTWVELTPA